MTDQLASPLLGLGNPNFCLSMPRGLARLRPTEVTRCAGNDARHHLEGPV